MRSKTGAISLGLLCLMATASFLYAAESPPGQEAPTIGELEAFATTAAAVSEADVEAALARAEAKIKENKGFIARDILDALVDRDLTEDQLERLTDLRKDADKIIERKEREAAKKAGYAPAPEEAERADEALMDYRRKVLVQAEMEKVQAAELIDEAKHLLYYERNPEKAYELATKALLLDPTNVEAGDVKTEAGAELGKEEEDFKLKAEAARTLPQVRREAALQSLRNTVARARRLYGEGSYEDALNQLRYARMYVETLAVSTDVAGYRQEVAALDEVVREAYGRAQRELSAAERAEAEREARERIAGITDVARKRQARLVEEVRELIEDKKFEEAERVLDNLEVEDPGDELVPKLREELSAAWHEHDMSKLNAATERGDMEGFERQVDREMVPERTFDYPDKSIWKTVIEKRESAPYPSDQLLELRTPEDQAVHDHLQDRVPITFRDTPLVDVVDFLEQTTEVNYMVFRNDIPADGAPVSLTMDTTLSNALDQICDLTGMAWKVDGGLIKVGLPETLRSYEWRVYFVHDLLLSIEERYSGLAGGGGGTRGGGTTGGGGGFGGGGAGGGGISFQFGSQDSGVAAQYQTGGQGGGRGGQGGAGGQQGGSYITDRGENLVLLLKQTCGPETWMDLSSTGIIDVAGVGGGGQGGGAGFGGAGGGAGGGNLPGEFGFGAGAGRAGAGATGFGPAGPAFGGPTAFGPTGMGFGPQAGLPGAGPVSAAYPEGRAFFRPDEPGLLIIIQTEEVHRCIEALLKNMRAAKKIQVQVDVRFLEVSSDFLREVGFKWQDFDMHPLEGFEGFQLYSLDSAPFIGTPLGPASSESPGLSLDLGWYEAGAAQLDGVFRLGHERGVARTLSAPRIVLANGQMGYLTVSTTKDYVSTFSVEDGLLIPETDSVDDGIDLSVRPIVSFDRRYVFLELQPTVLIADISRTFTFETGGAAAITTGTAVTTPTVTNFITLPSETQQTLETTVGVPDRGVLIVGGLSKTTRSQAEGGLPFLDKLPIIKRIFSAETERIDRSTLFIVVKPTIIILDEEEQRMH